MITSLRKHFKVNDSSAQLETTEKQQSFLPRETVDIFVCLRDLPLSFCLPTVSSRAFPIAGAKV